MRRRGLLAAFVASATIPAACGSDDPGAGSITVFAASSLSNAFTEIGAEFSSTHPGANVTFDFGASSTLARQIADGSPADVFAAADQAQMEVLAGAGRLATEPAVFATNSLEIIVGRGNPDGVSGIGALADDALLVVVAAPEVPLGAYTAEVLRRAGVVVTPRSYEENASAVVNKVVLGEADAGIVYSTDVIAAGDRAEGVPIPEDVNVVATYPIATVESAADAELAHEFVDYVLQQEGQDVLARYGFGNP